MDFKSELKNKIDYIESCIEDYLPREEGYQATIFKAMNYSVKSGGKRLRPILLMEAYRLCGGRGEDFIPYAVAMEFIHTYSLIHDDLPALDNDSLRRGKPTNHVVFGEDMAILAGDALLSHAYQIMLEASSKAEVKENSVSCMYEISKGAGIYGMVGGQVVDVESENKDIDLGKLNFIHENKTGAMITSALRAGAYLAGCDEDNMKKITTYGKNIGLAFQIVDDILDIEGDEKTLGKKVGSDIENKKSTYPSLVGMDESKKISRALIREAQLNLSDFGSDAEFLIELSEYINDRDK